MLNKCIVCGKEFEAIRPSKKTCSASCRQKLHREVSTVTKIVPIVTNPTVTEVKEVIVTQDRSGEKVLKFRKDEPMEKRIEKYKAMYPDSSFVPNWVAHGFLSKEEAIKNAIKAVQQNQGITSLGLGND